MQDINLKDSEFLMKSNVSFFYWSQGYKEDDHKINSRFVPSNIVFNFSCNYIHYYCEINMFVPFTIMNTAVYYAELRANIISVSE